MAQGKLGLKYQEGTGVPQNFVQSHMWYNLAAAQGLENGRKNREMVAKRMSPSQIEKAQRLAREWGPKK